MTGDRFDSVWDAIEDTTASAENMKLRSSLMLSLKDHIKAAAWTQTEAAEKLGVTQPRISDLVRGKIDLFSLDALVTMLSAAGLKLEVHVERAA
jgi:predicted XRE-type DNA-binding protein